MSKLTNQIKSLMSDEALRQALTKDSLQEMLNELDTNEIVIKDQESTIEALHAAEKGIREEYQGVKAARDLNIKLVNDLTAKLGDIEAREKACITLEIRNEYEKQRGDEMIGVVGMILKNSEYRKTVFDTKPVAVSPPYYDANGNQQYPGQIVEQHTTEITTKETEE